jgi:hypothetical protein
VARAVWSGTPPGAGAEGAGVSPTSSVLSLALVAPRDLLLCCLLLGPALGGLGFNERWVLRARCGIGLLTKPQSQKKSQSTPKCQMVFGHRRAVSPRSRQRAPGGPPGAGQGPPRQCGTSPSRLACPSPRVEILAQLLSEPTVARAVWSGCCSCACALCLLRCWLCTLRTALWLSSVFLKLEIGQVM